MSRIRTNLITNRMANGAPTVSHGLVVSGVTTVTTLDLNGDLDVDGHLNADNVSIAGVVTATTFVGNLTGNPTGSGANLTNLPAANLTGTLPAISGANLTSLPAQATIANNADNRVITGGSGVNLNGESNVQINSSGVMTIGNDAAGAATLGGDLNVANTNGGTIVVGDTGSGEYLKLYGSGSGAYVGSKSNHPLMFFTNDTGNERLRIGTAGQIGIAGANYGSAGQVLTSQGASSAVQWATPAAGGKILQVKQSVKTNTQSFSTGSSTLADSYFDISGLSVSLTPASGTKILVSYSVNVGGQSGYGQALVLFRDSTQIYLGDADGSRPRVSNFNMALNNEDVQVFSGMFLDTHGANGSTAVTYKLQMYVATPGWTSRVNRGQTSGNSRYYGRGASNITVMEVAA